MGQVEGWRGADFATAAAAVCLPRFRAGMFARSELACPAGERAAAVGTRAAGGSA